MPRDGDGGGPVIGHAVSADLARWALLPVALWNDAAYDSRAIFTGSTTIVDGVPTMVYPGLCTERAFPGCLGMDFAVAVPANRSGDPLLTNWTKPSYNPIVNGSGDDPTTAWRTAAGEWRMSRKDGKIFYSDDFVSWKQAACVDVARCLPGGAFFNVSECSDFFPMPRFCDGNGCAEGGPTPAPNFVHKQSANGDFYTIGRYEEGPPASTGVWAPSPGVPYLQPLDATITGGACEVFVSVAKSFYDSAQDRRLWFGWIHFPFGGLGAQSMARESRFHAGLRLLTAQPVAEMANLRAQPALFSAPSVAVPANGSVWLGDWAPGAGNQSELLVTFALPATSATFGVTVLNGRGRGIGGSGGGVLAGAPRNASSLYITIAFDAPSFTANVSVGNLNRVLPLIAGDAAVDIHVFLDQSIMETYIMGGRLAFTTQAGTPASGAEAGMSLVSDTAIAASSVAAFHLNSCWHSPSEVLAQRDEIRAARALALANAPVHAPAAASRLSYDR